MEYFVIKNYEDGPIFSGPFTKEDLESKIQQEIDEDIHYQYSEFCGTVYFDEFPRRTAYVIKGEAVVPKPKEVVVETELP